MNRLKTLRNIAALFSLGMALSSCARTDREIGRVQASTEAFSAQSVLLQEPGSLAAELTQLFQSPQYATAHWGVRVETLAGDVLYDLDGGKVFMPASQMKVFTTSAALDLLGPDFRYETRVELHGEQQGSTFVGDVVIVGSGDPSLGAWHGEGVQDSTELLPTWVAALRQQGIEKIDGRIIGDGRVFTEEFINTEWHYGDLPYWYAAGSSGLAMEENAFRCEINPGKQIGDLATVTWNPNTRYIDVIIETKTVAKDEASTADSFNFNTEGNTIYFAGQIPVDKVVNERASIWDGARYSAFLFKEACEREGLTVTGEAVNIRELVDSQQPQGSVSLLLSHQSPPLSELVSVVNKISHNFFADQVIRTLGHKVGKEGSFREGTRVVREWLQQRNIPNPGAFRLVDGSGLSTGNRFAPEQATALYRSMYADNRLAKPFFDSLPDKGEKLPYGVHAKSGFIGGVRTLGGYVETETGETFVFSMMCNLFNGSAKEVSETQDKAIEIMAEKLK